MTKSPASAGPVAPEVLADLAAASHILAAQGVVDAMGHISLRHPDAQDRFLMSRAMPPALVTPADLVEFDMNGDACGGDTRSGFLERFIHSEVYTARTDVMSVVHSHSPSVIPFGLCDKPMQAMFHNAAFVAAGVPVFDIRTKFGTTDMLICDCVRGGALAETLGDKNVALLRAHGSIAVGDTLQAAVFRAVYTEVNARIQHWALALASGGPLAALSPEEGLLADEPNQGAAARAWQLWRSNVRAKTNW
jgi:ribulose-5-phosphate 4-epimerase/fuculose-1-phosphate aldolase